MKSLGIQCMIFTVVLVNCAIPGSAGSVCGVNSPMWRRLKEHQPSGLIPCPCTPSQASDDPEFEEDNLFIGTYHPGADSCYRSVSPSASGSGQQCCYKNGDIAVGPPSGGTADRYSPKNWWNIFLHQFYDVTPWTICCDGNTDPSDCTMYYTYRPSDDCSGYSD